MSYAKAGLGRGLGSAFSNMGNMLMGIGERRRYESDREEDRRLRTTENDNAHRRQLEIMALGDPSLRIGGDTAPDKQVMGMIGNKAMVPRGESTWQGHDITMPSGSTTRVWRDPKYEETRMRREEERLKGEQTRANYAAWETLPEEIRGGAFDDSQDWAGFKGKYLAEAALGGMRDQRDRGMVGYKHGLDRELADYYLGQGLTATGNNRQVDNPPVPRAPSVVRFGDEDIMYRDGVEVGRTPGRSSGGSDDLSGYFENPVPQAQAGGRRSFFGGGRAEAQEAAQPGVDEIRREMNQMMMVGNLSPEEFNEAMAALQSGQRTPEQVRAWLRGS